MTNISINVVGIGTETYPSGTTPLQILSSTKGISKDTLICKVDKILTDLSASLTSDATVQFLDGKSKDGHNVLLHSTAHLMAQAAKRLYPKTKVTIGPYLEYRFYYDFDVETPFTDEDLLKISLFLHEIYNSYDLCYYFLREYDQRNKLKLSEI